MEEQTTFLTVLFVIYLRFVYSEPLVVSLQHLGTGYISYNDPIGINFTIYEDLGWVADMSLNGMLNRPIKMNHTGDIWWRFKRRRYNLTFLYFYFYKPDTKIKINDTVYYWIYTNAKNSCWYFVNPRKFTVLGDGKVI